MISSFSEAGVDLAARSVSLRIKKAGTITTRPGSFRVVVVWRWRSWLMFWSPHTRLTPIVEAAIRERCVAMGVEFIGVG